MSKTWSVEEHLEDILRSVRPLEPIELHLLDAQGCVLLEDVTVPTSLPPFDNSSMDGYAVRTGDVERADEESPTVLSVVGDIAAGSAELPTVAPGNAARIMTGAPLPQGADAVVPVEWTDGGLGGGPVDSMPARDSVPARSAGAKAPTEEVRVYRPVSAGQHVRAKGSDVRAGTSALTAGTVLGPAQIGLLAAIGRGTVRVRPRPRVVVLSTGSELVQPGERLAPGQIYDANSFALTSAARAAGALAYRVGAVTDDVDTLRSTIEDQLIRADAIVTSGGVSVGAYDVVKEALSRVDRADDVNGANSPDGADSPDGAEGGVDFRRLAMQPGKPQGFGLIGPDRTPLLTLPGNPVSAYVSFELFVRPVIRALMGCEPVRRSPVPARLTADEPITSPAGKRQFLRGGYTPGDDGEVGGVRPVGGASSHLVAALAHADALIDIPEKTTKVAPGDELWVLPLD